MDPIAPMTLARVNCLISMDLCVQEQIGMYPQLSLYYDGVRVKSDVKDDFSLEGLSAYVDKAAHEYLLRKTGQSNATQAASSIAASAPSSTATSVSSTASTSAAASTAEPSSNTAELSIAPLQGLTEFGTAAVPNEAVLESYLGAERGQGPSFVKCTSLVCLRQSMRLGVRTAVLWLPSLRSLLCLSRAR